MDWDTLEAELTKALVEQVREMIADFPGLDFHAAALGPLYYETDGIIVLPGLNFNTDGELSLSSPHALVRQHAVCVLGARRLGDEVGARVIPLLTILESADPDADVRRLAGLSLSDWKVK